MDSYSTLLLIVTGVLGALLIVILPTILGFMWKGWTKMAENVEKNTHALIELKVAISDFKEWTKKLPKMEKDIDAAHNKFREM